MTEETAHRDRATEWAGLPEREELNAHARL